MFHLAQILRSAFAVHAHLWNPHAVQVHWTPKKSWLTEGLSYKSKELRGSCGTWSNNSGPFPSFQCAGVLATEVTQKIFKLPSSVKSSLPSTMSSLAKGYSSGIYVTCVKQCSSIFFFTGIMNERYIKSGVSLGTARGLSPRSSDCVAWQFRAFSVPQKWNKP